MENNNDDNNVNNVNVNNNNEILEGFPARRRVRDFDLNKEPTPSPQVSGNDDCHLAMGEIEEVQSDQVPVVVQTTMGGVEEVQSDQVPVLQTEPSKDKGKRPLMVSSEEAHDKVDGGRSGVIQENITDADTESNQPGRKRQRLDSINIREPRVKVLIEVQNDEPIEDGYRWRKYGQKNIKGNNDQPRAYYRCSAKQCQIRKQVEMDGENPRIMVITYEGRHNHEPPTPKDTNNAAARAQNATLQRGRYNQNYNNITPMNTNNAAAAVAGAQNAILHGTINRNYNNIPPMQLHPLHHHFLYHTYEHGSSSNGSSTYRSPAVPFRPLLLMPPVAAAVNLNRSLNLNGGRTSSAPAEECSNKVPENNDDDKQKDI